MQGLIKYTYFQNKGTIRAQTMMWEQNRCNLYDQKQKLTYTSQ